MTDMIRNKAPICFGKLYKSHTHQFQESNHILVKILTTNFWMSLTEYNRLSFQRLAAVKLSGGLKYGFFEGYLGWLRNTVTGVQSQHLVKIELYYEAITK